MDATSDVNVHLIAAVEQYPCLYDVNDAAYKNNYKRNSIWDSVAHSVNLSVETVRTRWKTLRDRYKKEITKSRLNLPSTWCHFDSMKFLEPHLKDRSLIFGSRRNRLSNGSIDQQADDDWQDGIDSLDRDVRRHNFAKRRHHSKPSSPPTMVVTSSPSSASSSIHHHLQSIRPHNMRRSAVAKRSKHDQSDESLSTTTTFASSDMQSVLIELRSISTMLASIEQSVSERFARIDQRLQLIEQSCNQFVDNRRRTIDDD